MSEEKLPISDHELIDKLKGEHGKKNDNILTEIVTLPSKGYFYEESNPLSSGTIELKCPTAAEEDILTSKNLIQRGLAIDKFLQKIIVTDINYDDLLLGDKNGIMISARILAYGKDYHVKNLKCPGCDEINEITINLEEIQSKEIDFKKFKKSQQEFDFQFPVSKIKIIYKLLTQKDDRNISEELKKMNKIIKNSKGRDLTTRYKYIITGVGGKRDKNEIESFVDNILARDSLAFRQHLKDSVPDIDFKIFFECNECKYRGEVGVPLDASFFWPE